MGMDHLALKAESTIGTFVTPDVLIPVLSASSTPAPTPMMSEETGQTRGITEIDQGSYKPSGSIELEARPTLLPYLVKAALFNAVTKSTPGGATNARDHVFLQNDAAAFNTMSMQLQRTGNGTTLSRNLRGSIVNKLTIKASVDAYISVTVDYLAYEECKAGGTFSNGNSSVASITPTYATLLEKFSFKRATLTYGGTVAKDGTTKVYTQSSGTALDGLESITITIDNGIDPMVFLNSQYVAAFHPGSRKVDIEFTYNDASPGSTFYDKMVANTKEPIVVVFDTDSYIESTTRYQFEVVLPRVAYVDAPLGDLMGSHGRRVLTVKASGTMHPTTTDDVAIRFRDGNNTGY